MLKHNLSESIAGLEEAINRGLECLAEYGVQVGSHRRPLSHPAGRPRAAGSVNAEAGDQAAKALAIAAGVTVGLAAGLIVVGFLISRRRS